MELWSQSRIGPVNGSIVSRENVKQFAAGSTCSSYYMFVDVNERQPQPSAAPAGCRKQPGRPSPIAILPRGAVRSPPRHAVRRP